MFERPKKGDLDRNLSQLMHESRAALKEYWGGIKRKAGDLADENHPIFFGLATKKADELHVDAISKAKSTLLQFTENLELSASEIVGWARPHLDNLNASLLAVIPHSPENRTISQYRAVFQQRAEGMLRDVEIGFVRGAGFTRTDMAVGNRHVDVENALKEAQDATRVGVLAKEIEWISAAAAVELIKPHLKKSDYAAQMRICEHAYARLVRARARRYIIDEAVRDDSVVPHIFWWAKGHQALVQDWTTGSFSTEINDIEHRAFGVTFARGDLENMFPADTLALPDAANDAAAQSAPSRNKGGRPKHDFWEELWIEIARQLYVGDLKPQTQADIEAAMHQWISDQGHEAGGTTVRDRARMLWRAIEKDGTRFSPVSARSRPTFRGGGRIFRT